MMHDQADELRQLVRQRAVKPAHRGPRRRAGCGGRRQAAASARRPSRSTWPWHWRGRAVARCWSTPTSSIRQAAVCQLPLGTAPWSTCSPVDTRCTRCSSEDPREFKSLAARRRRCGRRNHFDAPTNDSSRNCETWRRTPRWSWSTSAAAAARSRRHCGMRPTRCRGDHQRDSLAIMDAYAAIKSLAQHRSGAAAARRRESNLGKSRPPSDVQVPDRRSMPPIPGHRRRSRPATCLPARRRCAVRPTIVFPPRGDSARAMDRAADTLWASCKLGAVSCVRQQTASADGLS